MMLRLAFNLEPFNLEPSIPYGRSALERLALAPHRFASFDWDPVDDDAATARTEGGTTFTLCNSPDRCHVLGETSAPADGLDPGILRAGALGLLADALAGTSFAIAKTASVELIDNEPATTPLTDSDRGLSCSKCGGPVPAPTPEMEALARKVGAPLAIDHAVCPGDEVAPGRQFSVVVSVVDAGDEATTDPYFRFTHTVEAETLDAAMRPLAEGLGQKWMAAEKQASIADGAVT